MAIDPFLYVAFGGGFVAGRIFPWRTRWLGTTTLLVVFALLLFLGASLGAVPGLDPISVIPEALAFAFLIVAATLGITILLPYRAASSKRNSPNPDKPPFPVGLGFLGAVVLGFGVGRSVAFPSGTLLTLTLYLLLALVAFDLRLSRPALRRAWVPLLAALGGAIAGAFAFSGLFRVPLVVSLATAFGFGWYTLAGPLVEARFGATLGLLAFLTNFLRETLTIVSAPILGPRVHSEGLAAMGGATSMDTTLYFVRRFGDPDAGTVALASGLVLTVAASLALPLLLQIPGG